MIALAFIDKTLEIEPPTVQSRIDNHRAAEEKISDAFSPDTIPVNSLQTVIGAITIPNIAFPFMNQHDPLRCVGAVALELLLQEPKLT